MFAAMSRNRSSRGLARGRVSVVPAATLPELIAQLGGNDEDKRAALGRLVHLTFAGVTITEAAQGIADVPGGVPALMRAMRRGLMVDERMAQQAAGVLAAAVQAASEEEVARALEREHGAVPKCVALLRGPGPVSRGCTAHCLAAFMHKGQVDAVVDTPGALLAMIWAVDSLRSGEVGTAQLLSAVSLACLERPDAVRQALAADASLLPLAAGLLTPSSREGEDGGATARYGGEEVPFADALRLTAARLLEAIASGGEALASRVLAQAGVFDGLLRLVPSNWSILSIAADQALAVIMDGNAEAARRTADAASPDAVRALAEWLGSGDQRIFKNCVLSITTLLRHCSTGGSLPARIADAAIPALAAAVCGSTDDETTRTCLEAIEALLTKYPAIRQRVARQPGLLRAIVAVLGRASSGDGGGGDSGSGKLAAAATRALSKISRDGEAARLLAATEGAAEALAAAARSRRPDTSLGGRLAIMDIAPHAALAALPAVLPVLTDWMECPLGMSPSPELLTALEAIHASEPAAAEAVARQPRLLCHLVRLSSASAAFEGSSGGDSGGDPCPCCSEPLYGDAQWRQALAERSDALLQSLCTSSAGAAAEVAAALGAVAASAVAQPGCHVARAARQLLGAEPLLLPPAAVDALCLAAQPVNDLQERCDALEERAAAATAEACAVRPAACLGCGLATGELH
jgi:hypothetical protein